MSLKDDVARLVPPPPAEKRLPAAVAPNSIRAQTGLERKQAGTIRSEEITVESTDGLFTFTVRVAKG